jgi:hypothetical protein
VIFAPIWKRFLHRFGSGFCICLEAVSEAIWKHFLQRFRSDLGGNSEGSRYYYQVPYCVPFRRPNRHRVKLHAKEKSCQCCLHQFRGLYQASDWWRQQPSGHGGLTPYGLAPTRPRPLSTVFIASPSMNQASPETPERYLVLLPRLIEYPCESNTDQCLAF